MAAPSQTSGAKSWSKSLQRETLENCVEEAITVIRRLVTVYRSHGLKTPDALDDVADGLGDDISRRRVRTLFHRDGVPVVSQGELHRLRCRAARLLALEAERARVAAREFEREAAALLAAAERMDFTTQQETIHAERQTEEECDGGRDCRHDGSRDLIAASEGS